MYIKKNQLENSVEFRLEIYQKALKEIEEYDESDGLCILLRNLSKHQFSYLYTKMYFEEFGEYFQYGNDPTKYKLLRFKDLFDHERIEWRIKVLKLCIKKCKTKLKCMKKN
jgi:hypothetical protein